MAETPHTSPDPRLGTADELRTAIDEVQRMGVQVVLFCKFIYADRSIERFAKELLPDTVKDAFGDYQAGGGYQYQTATSMLGMYSRILIPMCFGSESYLETCAHEFGHTVDVGAAGILFDECCHHATARMCFDDNHGHAVPWPVYANDLELIDRFAAQSDDDFLYAGEGCYDWQFQRYHLSYIRSDSVDHLPVSRYLLPHSQIMTAVTGYNDRNMINQCLLYRYLMSYEPLNFKGMPTDYPQTLAYGQTMDAFRTKLRDWVWDGEFRHTVGATVVGEDGSPHHPYSVFRHASTGAPAVAVANYGDQPVRVSVAGDGLDGPLAYHLVDGSSWTVADGPIGLPPESAAVVVKRHSADPETPAEHQEVSA